MIKYWITGVLNLLPDHDSKDPLENVRFIDVAWSGHATKQMVPFTVDWTDGGQEIVGVKDGVAEHDIGEIYGYSSRRHANTALVRLVQRGKGFVALNHVTDLTVHLVEYRSNGKRYLLDKAVQ